MKTPNSRANHIHPQASSVQSRSYTSSLLDRSTAQVPKQYASTKTTEAPLEALPRKIIQSPAADHDTQDADLSELRGLFTGKVRQRIANAKYYPRIARRRGMEGQPVIAFTLNKGGRLMKVDLERTSGYQLLNQAALEAVQQAAPYPEIPAELKANTFQFKLPISFVLK